MDVYLRLDILKRYFLSILLFALISFAYVDKVMNYSGAYTRQSPRYFDYTVNEIEFSYTNRTNNTSSNYTGSMYLWDESGISTNDSKTIGNGSQFRNADYGTLKFWREEGALFVNSTVCVEGTGKDWKLVVYGAKQNISRKRFKFYQVEMRKEPMTSGYDVIENSMAVFLTTRYVNIVQKNLFHFLNDFLVIYSSILKKAGQLGSGARNYVVMHEPFTISAGLRPFLAALNTQAAAQFHSHFFEYIPEHTCFKHAAFADSSRPPDSKRRPILHTQVYTLVQKVLSVYGLTEPQCSEQRNRSVTIVQRNDYRQIHNVHEIQKSLSNSLGSQADVRVCDFNKVPFAEKLRIVVCTDVLVGVQGAALTWGVFLRPNSSLVEVAKPGAGRPFYFATSGFQRKWYPHVHIHRVKSTKVVLPSKVKRFWLHKKKKHKKKHKTSQKESGKNTNVFVSPTEILETVSRALTWRKTLPKVQEIYQKQTNKTS